MTRAQAESILISRRAAAIVAAGLSAAPAADGSPRAYLGEPIAAALEAMGFFVADPVNPIDAELANVSGGRPSRAFRDVAELHAIETCVGNFAQVTYTKGIDGQSLSDFRRDLMEDAVRKLRFVADNYPELGLAAPPATSAKGA